LGQCNAARAAKPEAAVYPAIDARYPGWLTQVPTAMAAQAESSRGISQTSMIGLVEPDDTAVAARLKADVTTLVHVIGLSRW
jgi:hypothetical protein